jgi:proteasome alpha subunit
MSPALKGAFEQVFSAPYIVKMLLAELGEDPEHDNIVKLDYDGSFVRSEVELREPFVVLAGTAEAEKQMLSFLVEQNGNPRRSRDDAVKLAAKTWAVGMETAEREEKTEESESPAEKIDAEKSFKDHLKTHHVEAAVLERSRPATSKFRLLEEKEVRTALKDL